MHIKCPECGFSREVDDDKIPPRTQLATCPKCKHKFKFRELESPLSVEQQRSRPENGGDKARAADAPSPTSKTSSGDEQSLWDQLESMGPANGPGERNTQGGAGTRQPAGEVPWEHLERFGFFPGFLETIKLAMLHPMSFFGRMGSGGGLIKPLVFFLIISEIQALAQIVWQLAGIVPGMQNDTGSFVGISLAGLGSLFLLILLPILLTISLYIFSGLSHLCLMALRSASGGFEATFRAMCYGRAPLILSLIPVIGVLIGTFWTFYSTIAGLKQLHRISLPAAALGLFAPILLFVGLLLLLLSALSGQPASTF